MGSDGEPEAQGQPWLESLSPWARGVRDRMITHPLGAAIADGVIGAIATKAGLDPDATDVILREMLTQLRDLCDAALTEGAAVSDAAAPA